MDRSDSTIQIFLKMWQDLLENLKTIKISISRIDEKLRLLDEHNKKSIQDLRKKLDSFQSDLNEINQTLKPEESSKMEGNDGSADITESVHSIQDKVCIRSCLNSIASVTFRLTAKRCRHLANTSC